ncbi:MAG: hypothetical protein AAF551_04450, partial [Bacteroidota bacterium]
IKGGTPKEAQKPANLEYQMAYASRHVDILKKEEDKELASEKFQEDFSKAKVRDKARYDFKKANPNPTIPPKPPKNVSKDDDPPPPGDDPDKSGGGGQAALPIPSSNEENKDSDSTARQKRAARIAGMIAKHSKGKSTAKSKSQNKGKGVDL